MTDIEAIWRALVDREAERGGHVLVHSMEGGYVCVHTSVESRAGTTSPCQPPQPSLYDALLKALMNSSPVRQD